MKPRKNETDAIAELLSAGADSPESLANLVIQAIDTLRGERQFHYGAYITAGIPGVVGPFSTKGQAERAVKKIATDKAWVVLGHTGEGLDTLLARVDAPVERRPPSAKEQQKLDRDFWRRAAEIRNGDGEKPGLIVDSIKVLKP